MINAPPLRLGVNVDHVATLRNARGGARPDPVRAALLAIEAGADGITAQAEADWQRIVAGARLARSAGLEVHAGHGLDYATSEKIAGLAEIAELNIGYFMIGEAVFVGLAETVRAMRAAMDRGRRSLTSQPHAGQA